MRSSKAHISKLPTSSDLYNPAYIKKWSCLTNKELPSVQTIKSISIIDFDNTLFKSPLPNPAVWSGPALGSLSGPNFMLNGGWWHDNRILAATGLGMEAEEQRAWEGHWNETIVDLVQLSVKDPECLTVLLTGRSMKNFPEIIQRMIDSKKLTFDMFVLRPTNHPHTGAAIANTLAFKLIFLEELLHTYTQVQKMYIYEDRKPHCISFKEFGAQYNKAVCLRADKDKDEALDETQDKRNRLPVDVEVIQVAEMHARLDPLNEIAEVQKMIIEYNQAPDLRGPAFTIRKSVSFTGYMLPVSVAKRLQKLFEKEISRPERDGDIKYLASSILITPRPCPKHILQRIGGMGAKVDFTIVGFGSWDDQIWAARVEPSPSDIIVHSDNTPMVIVLAHKKTCRPVDAGRINNWQNISSDSESRLTFTTTIGERSMLFIEEDVSHYSPVNNSSSIPSPKNIYNYNSASGLDYDETSNASNSAYSQVHRGQRKRRAEHDNNGHSSNYRGQGRGNRNNNSSSGQGNGGGYRGRGSYRGFTKAGDRDGSNSSREPRY